MKGPRCPYCGTRFQYRMLRDEHHAYCTNMRYELVICSHHGSDPTTDDTQLAYIVCTHILERKAKPVAYVPATERRMGEILCEKLSEHDVDDLKVVCFTCCREQGLITA